ncbi:hypothetical protein DICVIV_13433 [Dictyocaulus viviparus]|uniref:Uncharacterized protein n=1 Tax=Dictyocaulus viviparus TaxID=29172 RepID=A0A0D8X7T4_DICVI|nr:hypothetical protein DICVIV_13433 [Dictyocaulus viviparus]
MEFRPEYGRPPPEFYRNIDYSDYRDFRDADQRSHEFLDYSRNENPQRARSHSRLDPEFIPSEFLYSGRPLEKSFRSKSLDHHDGFRDEPRFFEERRGVNIPIHRERIDRIYDHDRDVYTPFTRREERKDGLSDTMRRNGTNPREMDVQAKRVSKVLTRSNEWIGRRNGDRLRSTRDIYKAEGHSPKSASSSKRHNLNISVDPVRARRDYARPEEYVGYGHDDGREMYRAEGRNVDGDVRGGAKKRQTYSSYHYESHGGGYGSPSRRMPITQQPHHASSGVEPVVLNPIRHHQVKCCCLSFTWPPWSYEPTTPPQPLYRNI